MSRQPITIERGASLFELNLDALPSKARVDGEAVGASFHVAESALRAGVLLQLSSRVLLLLHTTAAPAPSRLDGLLGASDAIERLRQRIVQIGAIEVPVLIHGETGVGKELVARALHQASARAAAPLLAVNMATLSDTTAAAALFGHARGAFTGSVGRHRGWFERADGGTLFLDEVGDTPHAVQAMLLRVLETRRFQPLGDEQERAVDVRVIAATECEIETAGGFRGALRHRLAGYEIAVPALRERRDDIPRLFVHFMREELQKLDRDALLNRSAEDPAPPLRAELVRRLLQHPFPGNVRELANLARKLAIESHERGVFELGEHEHELGAEEAAARAATGAELTAASDPEASDEAPRAFDEAALLAALERHDFSPLRAAAELGVPPSTVHFWMRRERIRRAADYSPDELQRAYEQSGGDLEATARRLRISSRALKLALGRSAGSQPEPS